MYILVFASRVPNSKHLPDHYMVVVDMFSEHRAAMSEAAKCTGPCDLATTLTAEHLAGETIDRLRPFVAWGANTMSDTTTVRVLSSTRTDLERVRRWLDQLYAPCQPHTLADAVELALRSLEQQSQPLREHMNQERESEVRHNGKHSGNMADGMRIEH